MTEQSDRGAGWIASVGIHGLILLAFLIMQVNRMIDEPEPIPVSFAALSSSSAETIPIPYDRSPSLPKVDLPARPMIDESSALLRISDADRMISTSPPTLDKPELTDRIANTPRIQNRLISPLPVERERAPVTPMKIDDDILQPQPDVDPVKGQLENEPSFDIAWEGPKRTKTGGELPRFPKGVNRAATVQLAVIVAPDGSVVSVTLQTKGIPELDQVSVDAVRSWRFSALDAAVTSQNQKGIITFNYRLK